MFNQRVWKYFASCIHSPSFEFYFRHAVHKRKRQNKFGPDTVMSVPNVASMASVHDFHKFAIHHNGVAPALHFHLAASVNPETGKLPLTSSFLSLI